LTADISDFTPGTVYSVGQLPGGRFGTFICYEAIFPSEIANFARGGAELLINISNDGWFGRSAAPPQHLMMSRVRAVESRRWMLRDTNNGYTVSLIRTAGSWPKWRRMCAASWMRLTIFEAIGHCIRFGAIGSLG
jgi:apolipoprotein N-acyltransferase